MDLNQTNLPKITVVTPSYNQGVFIEETIQSVLDQNYPNLEYFIFDGGSTDETVSIIEKYSDKIDFWVSEKDKGQTDAITKGFKKATGDIITWLNSDDVFEPNALHTIAEQFLTNPDKAFIYGHNIDFDLEGNSVLREFPSDDIAKRIVYDFPFSQPACFYRRQVLDVVGYPDIDIQFGMDHDFFLRILMNYDYLKIQDVLTKQRIHDDTKTSNLLDIYREDVKKIVRTFLYNIPQTPVVQQSIDFLEGLLGKVEKSKKYPVKVKFSDRQIHEILFGHLTFYIGQWYNKGDFDKVNEAFAFFDQMLGEEYLKASSLNTVYSRFKNYPTFLIKFMRLFRK